MVDNELNNISPWKIGDIILLEKCGSCYFQSRTMPHHFGVTEKVVTYDDLNYEKLTENKKYIIKDIMWHPNLPKLVYCLACPETRRFVISCDTYFKLVQRKRNKTH